MGCEEKRSGHLANPNSAGRQPTRLREPRSSSRNLEIPAQSSPFCGGMGMTNQLSARSSAMMARLKSGPCRGSRSKSCLSLVFWVRGRDALATAGKMPALLFFYASGFSR